MDHIDGVIHQLIDQGLQLNINETCSKELLMCDFNHDVNVKPIPGDTCGDCITAAKDVKRDVEVNPSKLIYQLTKAVDVFVIVFQASLEECAVAKSAVIFSI